MKVDVSQFRKRPTFEEVANIINEDKYKIDLPERTYIRWEDSNARMQFENFRDATAEAELTRARRQAVQAGVMAPPTARIRGRDGRPTPGPGQTLLTGEPTETESEQPKGKGRKKRLTEDVVMRHSSQDDDDDMGDPDAASNN